MQLLLQVLGISAFKTSESLKAERGDACSQLELKMVCTKAVRMGAVSLLLEDL